ncbi:BnaA06g01600D [Brassica napus]|uniref:BnaA06g01600D protein n=1 Tax=Brassica napus TaxID=3708 RepID=A0A078IPL4_BRANA|nr:BnaA06g01600D [Brassica napus]
MGCAQSKIENEEAVTRCKERKQFMKDAVVAPSSSLPAAVSPPPPSSAAVISNSAASSSSAAEISQPMPDTLPPPPPPPPLPLQRAATMPEMNGRSGGPPGSGLSGTIIEEDDDGDDDSEVENHDRLVRKSKSRGGSSRGRPMIDDHHHHQEAPPPPLPQSMAANQRPIPPPRQHQQQEHLVYDYFFASENIPGTTLEDTPPPPQAKPAPPQPASPSTDEDDELEDEEEEEEDEPVVERKPPVVVEERPKRVEEPSVELEKVANFRGMKKPIGGERRGGGRFPATATNLGNVFNELDDNFLKASESAHEVSKMLEATRLHYHSNFADNRGHIDHSARVMRVITWNRSFRGLPNADVGKDDFDSEENETHATVLDKLLAWEKKLYDEVKSGELMKIEYQRKVAHLNRVKKRGGHSDSLERAKAAVSQLHTRYIVDMQSMDSTVSEINRLRDEQLYVKLLHLVEAMGKMWEMMQMHHQRQAEISKVLRSLDISQAVKETNDHHHERTIQLLAVVQEWHTQFCRMIDNQKMYIKSLGGWLKLNLIPIESTLKEKVSSPPRVPNPAIQKLLHVWYDRLDKIPDEMARTAIINFAAVVSTIMQQQEEEMKLRDRCEETRKELGRKIRQFEDWYHKYMQKRGPEDMNADGSEGDNEHKDEVVVRQFNVEQIKKRLEEEEEAYQRQSQQVREKSIASLRTRLPELFQAMSEVAYSCSGMYRAVVAYVTQRQSQSERHQKPPSQGQTSVRTDVRAE